MTATPATEPTQPLVMGEWQPLPGATPHTPQPTPKTTRRGTGPLTKLAATLTTAAGLYTGVGGPLHYLTLNPLARHIALGIAAAAALLLLTTVLATKFRGPDVELPTAGRAAVTIGAVVCTGVGLNTAWHFTFSALGITDTFTRVSLCGTGEIVLLSLALAARDNLRIKQATGLPGTLVWIITAFLAVPAYTEGADTAHGFWQALVAGTWRSVFGPVGAALLWHFAMGLEIRAADATAKSMGVAARIARRLGQRLLVRFGIGEEDTTASELLARRARTQAANLVDRYANLYSWAQKSPYGRWLRRRLRSALRTAGVSADPTKKALLLEDLAVSAHAPALAQLKHNNPWTLTPVSAPERAALTPSETPTHSTDAQPTAPAVDAQSAPTLTTETTPSAPIETASVPARTAERTTVSAPIERAHKHNTAAHHVSERPKGDAQSAPSLSDRKALKEQQDALTLKLYKTLERRPEWTEIRDALTAKGLAEVSRPTAQRIRERVESAHSELLSERPALTANE
ncbi:hypothetical protein ACFV3R_25240 [Streptomyces sp. NPDC059740]|uniref:hypothetical protein n=1 Tax=Streptomyces sp. NPDC059740 TaxID=3346926 RepID=UPI0036476B9C